MIGFDTFRCEWDTDRIRIITYSCLALRIIALFSSAELFWYFSKFGRGWKWPCGELRIRYELLRTLRMWYVSLRNARIVADGFYVPSAGSVSVCVTGALGWLVIITHSWGAAFTVSEKSSNIFLDNCYSGLESKFSFRYVQELMNCRYLFALFSFGFRPDLNWIQNVYVSERYNSNC